MHDGQAQLNSRRIPSIRSRLVWLAAACIAPAFLMMAALLYVYYERDQSELVRDSQAKVRALSFAIDREFVSVETMLIALAGSPDLAAGNLAAFDQQARDLVKSERVTNVLMADPSGQQIINTRRPAGSPLPVVSRMEAVTAVTASKQTFISNLLVGQILQRALVSVSVPVKRNDEVVFVLLSNILPARFSEILTQQQLADDRVITILDRSATVVTQNMTPEKVIGQKAPQFLRDQLDAGDQGLIKTTTAGGDAAMMLYHRSPETGWTVALTVPQENLLHERWRTLWWLIAATAFLLLATLGLAWAMGGQITRAVRALRESALALGEGQLPTVHELPIREVDDLGKAMVKASEMLSHADAARTISEARMRGILESAMDAIITIDQNQRIVLYNQAAEKIFGWPSQQVLGEHLEKLMPERFRGSHASHVRRFADTGVTSRRMGDGTVLYGQRANGDEFPMEASISQLSSPEGMLYSVILRDVTARVRNQAALERSNLDLQQFAFVASHDLKTPLRSIGGFMQLLEKNYADKLDDKAKMLIRRTTDATQRLEQLTEDLLSYARVNSETRAFEAVNCNEVADNVIDLLDAAVRGSDAVVTVGELPAVMGDRIQLVQLFLNLIGNAIKYCAGRAPEVRLSAMHNGSAWVFSVRDNGIGIDSKHHERIFEIFKRLHTQKEYVGTGIGLAICRRIVEHHGGGIWVNSESGRGSTFCFTIADISAESSPS